MTGKSELGPVGQASIRQLLAATVAALAIAVVLLVTVVMPAEYNVDPLGTGRRLGLTAISAPRVSVAVPTPVGDPLKPIVKGPLGQYSAGFKTDSYDVTLEPYDYVEYKYHLEQGANLVYHWKASAPVIQDFHGERAAQDTASPAEESYDKQDLREASGNLTAPFTGIHGWYWENPGASPITIHLTSAGFYGAALEIRSDRSRHPRTLRPLDATSSPPADGVADGR